MAAPKTPLREERSALERALRRADRAQSQGQTAQRNARTAVLNCLREVRKSVDNEFPVVRRAPKQRAKWTPEQRAKHLLKNGYTIVTNSALMAALAGAGIRVRTLRYGGKVLPDIFAPRWATILAKSAPSRLSEARKKPALRKALMAAHELKTRDW